MKTAKEVLLDHVNFGGNTLESDVDCVLNAMEEYAQQFANQNKWISIKIGVPKESGLVLTIVDKTECYISFYKKGRNQFEIYGLGRIQPVTDMNVTHWQPLPNPPKDK